MRVKLLGLLCLTSLLLVDGAAAREIPPLIAAVKQGDTAAVRDLLRQHVDVNTPDVDGTTAVHWAVQRGDLATLESLITAGADVKVVTRYGVTPLSLAVTVSNAAIVKRLLKAGADPGVALPGGGETPLMTAARTGDVGTIEALLAGGADVNAAESRRGQTALMWAADEGNTAAVRTLVKAGANLTGRSRGPQPTATTKTRRGSGGRIDAFTPLMFAVRAGNLDTARYLLEAGADVNDTAEDGTSLLTIAITNAHWELAAFLLENGADPSAAGQGWTALHQLVRTRNPNLGQMPGPVQTGRLTSVDLAKKLVEYGADVNARMKKDINDGNTTRLVWKDCTPLLLAAKASDHEIMRVLVSLGADPKLKNAVGSTVLMLTAGLAMYHVALDSGSDEASIIATQYALEIGGGDVNDVDADGDTALHGAAQRFRPDAAKLLLEHGARVDIKNAAGATALMMANGFNIVNQQKQPQLISLLRQEMIARGVPPDMWIAGQAKVDESIFDVDPTAANAVYRRGEESGGNALAEAEALKAAEAAAKKPQPEKKQ